MEFLIFLFLWLPVNLFLFFILVPCNVSTAAVARENESLSRLSCGKFQNESCSPQSCGDFYNIRCPFTLKDANNPHNCSNPVELICDENHRTIFNLLPSQDFYVLDISYKNYSMVIVDPGLQNDNCSSMPRYPFSIRDFSERYDLFISFRLAQPVIYMNCSNRVDSPYYVDTSPCINTSSSNNNSTYYSYVVASTESRVKDLQDSCTCWMISWMTRSNDIQHSYFDIHSQMSNGFELYWGSADRYQSCFSTDRRFSIDCILWYIIACLRISTTLFIGRFVLGTPFVVGFMIYILLRRRRAMDPVIEDYLHDYKNQMPIRYTYNDVKKMARNFKEKLGQGGYGSVFKGVLSNSCPVAIKIMVATKGNGQEFINEVASIGRIHHVNVVRLIGFVAERSKRALIYEFMPNGSLEKYIFSQEGNLINPLSWMKMYDIALGIARGMDYLHRGCDMQILHFDIKPHNVLLDKNFIPKISDFGLAKLYSAGDSIVSMTAARGTIGYVAPELLYRNIGGISYKSDVYSFGVMLLEMAGRRKNINAFAENSSQIYFPSWIYDQLNQGNDIAMEDIVDEKEKELAKKMIIVGLWCIQMKPVDRPSMLKVIQMLEDDLGALQIPPKPNVLPDKDSNAISIY